MQALFRRLVLAFTLAAAPALALGIRPAAAQEAPEPATVPELVKALEATYKDVSSLRADFVQVKAAELMRLVCS